MDEPEGALSVAVISKLLNDLSFCSRFYSQEPPALTSPQQKTALLLQVHLQVHSYPFNAIFYARAYFPGFLNARLCMTNLRRVY